MSRKFQNVLDEIDSILPSKDKNLVVESRASHAISSAINVMEMIKENFSAEEANDLQRRFLLAIKNSNPKKFEQGMKKLKGSK